ncbi:hypothetical protein TNCV_1126571 [Trichonephila clavipes]|nr:hypothetical protein TNCV_1126571 [Trichonephila clavipes]
MEVLFVMRSYTCWGPCSLGVRNIHTADTEVATPLQGIHCCDYLCFKITSVCVSHGVLKGEYGQPNGMILFLQPFNALAYNTRMVELESRDIGQSVHFTDIFLAP